LTAPTAAGTSAAATGTAKPARAAWRLRRQQH
jgi:hypothetical protein